MTDAILNKIVDGVLVTMENIEAAGGGVMEAKRPPIRLDGVLAYDDFGYGPDYPAGDWMFHDGDRQSRAVYQVQHDAVELDANKTYLVEVEVVKGHPALSSREEPCVVKVLTAEPE